MEKKQRASNRQRIIAAAIEGFLEAGLHQTGIRDIAKRAGVSLGNLYNHFSGKEALIAEIAQMEAAEIQERVSTLPSEGTALSQICALYVAEMQAIALPENAALTVDLTAEALRQPAIGALFAENEATMSKALRSLADQAIAAKEIKDTPALDNTLILLLEAAHGMGLRCAMNKKGVTEDLCHALKTMVLNALKED